jgi:O-succinylbenzoic acid--CoA ligase
MQIDFHSPENLVLINPRIPSAEREELRARLSAVDGLTGHAFLLTSGSSGGSKWVALAKPVILAAARAANITLASDARDTWFHALPDFHVGGLSIYARAQLSGARVVKYLGDRWDPAAFTDQSRAVGATLASLVPTQVHDLVTQGFRGPDSLRAILVGGGALSAGLYRRAWDYGWRVLPTYGMTETASQVATLPLESDGNTDPTRLQVLPHLEAKSDDDGRILVRGESLLTGYVLPDGQFWDPKSADGWFSTEDLGSVNGRELILTGRVQDRIKIGGELANLAELERVFAEEAGGATGYTLVALPDDRLEFVIGLVVEGNENLPADAVARYEARVPPFCRIRRVVNVPRIPRSDLGKVKRAELMRLLGELT